jgi:hypothetical protein
MLTGAVLRSGDPAGVEQELWASLTLYQVLRRTMTDAIETRPGTDPDRACFTTALETARDQVIAGHTIAPAPDSHGPVGEIGRAVLATLLPERRARMAIRVDALQRVGGELRFVRPKTEDSERTIPLPELCVEALKAHKERQATERSNAWPDWQENGLVFPSRIGTPLEPDNLRRSWGRIRKAAKLGDVRFHDIRHTCVSLLLDLGVPPHIVRDIVGHSDIEVTMTIYAHAALDEKRKALRKLGEALG